MTTPATRHRGNAIESRACTIIARMTAINGNGAVSPVPSEGRLIVASDVASISVSVFDADSVQIGSSLMPSIVSTIFDTLQTSETWSLLNGGGNFRYTIPASHFPTGSVQQGIEATVTLNDGSKATGLWFVDVLDISGS